MTIFEDFDRDRQHAKQVLWHHALRWRDLGMSDEDWLGYVLLLAAMPETRRARGVLGEQAALLKSELGTIAGAVWSGGGLS